MKQSLFLRVFLPIGILLMGLAVFVILKKTRPEPPRRPGEVPRPLVTVFTVSEETPRIVVTGYGTVRAKRRIELVPQVSGVVVEQSPRFEPGGFFDEGELLLRIDDADYRLAADKAAADVARADYNLALATEEGEVARREWAQLGLDGEDLPENPNPLVFHEPQLNLASAELTAARAAHDRARTDLRRCRVTAPFAGRVMETRVDAGQYIRAGTAVGTIYATDVAEVTVPISDNDLAWIQVADRQAGAGLPANSGVADHPTAEIVAEFAGAEHHWPGRVARLGGAIDETSRRVPLVVEIPDPYRPVAGRPPLVEGMFVKVIVQGQPVEDAVVIPRAALRDGNRVWVVDSQDRLTIRAVEVARADVENAIIVAGLRPRERICLTQLQVVTDGLLVRVADPAGVSDGAGRQP